jgi:hypothetical protein
MNGICFVPGRRFNETACASSSIASLGAALDCYDFIGTSGYGKRAPPQLTLHFPTPP